MLPLAPDHNTVLQHTCRITAKMKFNGHSSSFKLGATPVATLNYHCKIMMNQEDEFGDSSISLHVSRLIRTRVCEKKKKEKVAVAVSRYLKMWFLMAFLPCGPLRTISKTPNNVTKKPKPTAHKLKFSIQASRYALCPQKGWNLLTEVEVKYSNWPPWAITMKNRRNFSNFLTRALCII